MLPRLTVRLGSVRLRTTAAATLVLLLTLAVGGWLLLTTLESALADSQDDAARARVEALVGLASADRLPGELPSVGDDGFAQVVDSSAAVVASTSNVAGRPAATTFRPGAGKQQVTTVRDVRDDQDLEDYRVWAARTRSPTGPVTVYVATSLEVVSETVATLRRLLLLGIPVIAGLLAALTWLVVGRALQPVEAMRAEVAGISDAEHGRRVAEPRGDDEIARLARTMNRMLGRLQDAGRRQAAFTADASHELQSPLASLRAQVEVALARPDHADWPGVGREVLAEIESMERMVRDLLYLAQEHDTDPPPGELVDLDDVVLEEAARARSTATVELVTGAVSAAPVRGSREQLRRLARNVIENAVRHAAARVDISLTSSGGQVRLVIRDDGPGVPASAKDKIFERFVRGDDARSRQVPGAGLGLSIAASIAQRHGGSVELLDPNDAHEGAGAGSGASFLVRLPAAGPASRPER